MDSRKKLRSNSRLKSYKFVGFLIGSLVALNVLLSITTSTKGTELIGLEREIATLKLENSELEEKIVKNKSLTTLSEITEELGLAKPEKILYLKLSDQVAQIQ